jgi:hypothetical protein
VKAVEGLKAMSGKNVKYELELDSLGCDVDSLRAAMPRLSSLVGTPTDGIAFDLFAMMDHNEEGLLDLDNIVQGSFAPRLIEVEGKALATQSDVLAVKASVGDKLMG